MQQPMGDSTRFTVIPQDIDRSTLPNGITWPVGPQRFTPSGPIATDYKKLLGWANRVDQDDVREVLRDVACCEDDVLFAALRIWLNPSAVLFPPRRYDRFSKKAVNCLEEYETEVWDSEFDFDTAVGPEGDRWANAALVLRCISKFSNAPLASEKVKARLFDLVNSGFFAVCHMEQRFYTEAFYTPRWEYVIENWRAIMKQRGLYFEPNGFVYLLGGDGYYKIGKAKDVGKRLEQLVIQLPWKVSVEHTIPCEDYSKAERHLHEIFSDKRANGEWFNLDDSDLKMIKGIKRMRGDRIE